MTTVTRLNPYFALGLKEFQRFYDKLLAQRNTELGRPQAQRAQWNTEHRRRPHPGTLDALEATGDVVNHAFGDSELLARDRKGILSTGGPSRGIRKGIPSIESDSELLEGILKGILSTAGPRRPQEPLQSSKSTKFLEA